MIYWKKKIKMKKLKEEKTLKLSEKLGYIADEVKITGAFNGGKKKSKTKKSKKINKRKTKKSKKTNQRKTKKSKKKSKAK